MLCGLGCLYDVKLKTCLVGLVHVKLYRSAVWALFTPRSDMPVVCYSGSVSAEPVHKPELMR